MSQITFKPDGTAIWADTGRPVSKTVNFCARKRLGIEHAQPSKEMDRIDWRYQPHVQFRDISEGMRIPQAELYIMLRSLPVTTDEMYQTDDVARVLNIPPGTLAGKCRIAKAQRKK